MNSIKVIFGAALMFFSISGNSQNPSFDICPVKNSEEVPEVTLYGMKGEEVNLSKYIADKPSIIVFYRGGWCPYCMKHLSALQEIKPEIDKLGYELIAITPDDFSNLDKSIKNSEGFDYTLLSDKNADAIQSFGIGWTVAPDLYEKYKKEYSIDLESWSGEKHHILPVPAVFVVEKGKISYQHVDPDYSKRLSGKVLLSYLGN